MVPGIAAGDTILLSSWLLLLLLLLLELMPDIPAMLPLDAYTVRQLCLMPAVPATSSIVLLGQHIPRLLPGLPVVLQHNGAHHQPRQIGAGHPAIVLLAAHTASSF